ncbi:MAG TPA: hypothetical protein VNM43_02855 [Dehalococcoidia bacterium]|nr:hypothetical protein [Dehalococcoidia bacterium]
MDRAARFLELFTSLEAHLRKLTRTGRGVPFYRLVDRAAEIHTAVKRHADRLKRYADLRNAIVHHAGFPRDIIAEPTEKTLDIFETVVNDILSPPRLIPMFQKEIHCFSPRQPLAQALNYMRDHDFSQVVVRKRRRLALLTAEGVATWLERQADKDIVSLARATVGQALACDDERRMRIMSGNHTLYDAQDAFSRALEPRLFAILITTTGKPHEDPLGIVTAWDIIHHANSLPRE